MNSAYFVTYISIQRDQGMIIHTLIRIYDKLLIVLSEASLQSEWVMTELRKAHKAERQSGKQALPRAVRGFRDAARLGVLRCRQWQGPCRRAA